MAPKWVPKRIKNRSKNMIDFQIDFEALLESPSAGRPPENERAGAVEGGRGEANPSLLDWNWIGLDFGDDLHALRLKPRRIMAFYVRVPCKAP